MLFWLITIALALIVALLLALALLRGRAGEEPAAAYDLRVYRDQLKEVDRDLARGVIAPEDAERVRTEISRRILAADAQVKQGGATGGQPQVGGRALAIVTVLGLVLGSSLLYLQLGAPGLNDLPLKQRIAASEERRKTRPSQADFVQTLTPIPARVPSGDYAELMTKLRQTVQDRPDELRGQMLLARNEASLGNYGAARAAQQRVIAIKGDGATAQDHTILADLMINEAQGYVSPEAEAALNQALSMDPRNSMARYYSGLMMMQIDRPDRAFHIWEGLLNDSPADAPWVPAIRGSIEELAWRAGVKYRLPELPAARPAAPALSGPTAEDMQAAGEMSAKDRQEMIQNMVSQLSERLATEGGPPEEWSRLIGAYGVMGETDRARAIYDEAQQVFKDDTAALDILRAGAQRAGIAQ